MWYRGYDGMMPFGIVLLNGLWLLFLGGLVALVIYLVTRRTGGVRPVAPFPAGSPHGRPGPATSGPLAILDERLARGEIDIDTYRRVRAELAAAGHEVPTAPAPPPPPTTLPPPPVTPPTTLE